MTSASPFNLRGVLSFALGAGLGFVVLALLVLSSGIPQFYGGPCIMIVISAAYFLAGSKEMSITRRLLASAHGLLAALIFAGAAALHFSGKSRPIFGIPVLLLYAIPLVFVLGSFSWYRGPSLIHVLQGPNLAAMLWSAFYSGMAASGEWL
jgi:hypothetical protein